MAWGSRGGRTRIGAWAAAVALAVGGITYSSWVLDLIEPSGLDRFRTFLSQLEEPGVPWHQAYEYGDIVTGVLVITAAMLLQRSPRTPGVAARIATVAVGCFGAATVADALSPLDAVPVVHAVTSALAVFALFVTMGATTWAAVRDGAWPPMATAGALVFAVVALSTGWMLVSDRLDGDHLLGLAQRIQVGGMSAWLVVWGVSVGRSSRTSSSNPIPATPRTRSGRPPTR
ncbi:DUF998 domain-containing protein [Gordonia humi]|uniref:DUF998 domain-containing protein n=1 Tax=Gordonia humi TaxID=686429 RepID=A0A840EQI7_9ACTN|nr:DUF998 domain-containing protein [Gordonia humi]MBB4133771.1 hypothetical protein [Gordonia humi]